MIGKLKGTVDTIAEDHIILDVHGVGYLVQCPASTMAKLSVGEAAALLIEMKVSEDAIRLYGFASSEEREWFRLLQTVQSVGARVALNILSALNPRAIGKAIALADKAMIGQAQGVGPKLATRIITELKDKAPNVILRQDPGEVLAIPANRGPEADAVLALTKLGYSQSVAAESVAKAAGGLGEGAALDTLIREALRAMGR
ncbi:Holliday junction DNA helicase RuvA [Rhizomicrobium palustre]|uniref:Holliday junction branch migration complex subunit RuvA n=1 Tax=Rhizomicrobium palustre TaxID=189966 RepID=A0A846MZ62_9PROT|nr:Holliday junction branch migration protein RuvA [Rhizomicrobium palustre]NIK88736.1 Holliday junction DNA helicase RuvA [Rhizomicrobium palustre]